MAHEISITTIVVKNDNFETVGLHIRTEHTCFSWGVSPTSPFCWTKTIQGSYYEEYMELREILREIDDIKGFEHRFFDIAAATLGYEALEDKGFKFDKEAKRLEELEARQKEIINSIK